jgi:hypothetical protein
MTAQMRAAARDRQVSRSRRPAYVRVCLARDRLKGDPDCREFQEPAMSSTRIVMAVACTSALTFGTVQAQDQLSPGAGPVADELEVKDDWLDTQSRNCRGQTPPSRQSGK